MTEDLDNEVRSLLLAHKGDWKRIAMTSGVSHSWISKFVNGHATNPGYARLRDLREALKTDTRAA